MTGLREPRAAPGSADPGESAASAAAVPAFTVFLALLRRDVRAEDREHVTHAHRVERRRRRDLGPVAHRVHPDHRTAPRANVGVAIPASFAVSTEVISARRLT